MDGLSEKINQILENQAAEIKLLKNKEEVLIKSIDFYEKHNLQEEKRIALIKYDSASRILYKYNDMFLEILKAVENWNS